jgi:hypothetical protein
VPYMDFHHLVDEFRSCRRYCDILVVTADDLAGTVTSVNYTVPEEERMVIVENDRIGW